MDSKISAIISAFTLLLLFSTSPVCPDNTKHNFRHGINESEKQNYIKALLEKINKPAIKTIQGSDGDLIDCVPFHLQPAFDHPLLKGHKPQMVNNSSMSENKFQVWSMSGESCPDNTIPIKRTTEQDVLRANSIRKFAQKTAVRRDVDTTHEHAIGYATGKFYGAQATLSVWLPHVENRGEFSLSQMWILDGTLKGNSIEVGWMAWKCNNPSLIYQLRRLKDNLKSLKHVKREENLTADLLAKHARDHGEFEITDYKQLSQPIRYRIFLDKIGIATFRK